MPTAAIPDSADPTPGRDSEMPRALHRPARSHLAGTLAVAATVYLGFSLLAAPGCHLLLPYQQVCTRYACETPIYSLLPTHRPIGVSVTAPVDPNCFQWQPAKTAAIPTGGFAVDRRPYCEQNFTVKEIGLDALKGAGWITTRFRDADATCKPQYLVFVTKSKPRAVYVAYDGRVVSAPAWLGSDYRLETQSGGPGSPPAYVRIANPFSPKKEAELRVWSRQKDPIVETDGTGAITGYRYEIPGNQCGTPVWPPPPFTKSQSGMFIVLVKPEEDRLATPAPEDFWKTKKFENVGNEEPCYSSTNLEAAAMADCRQWLKAGGLTDSYVCVQPASPPPAKWCEPLAVTADKKSLQQALGRPPADLSYLASSYIAFDPVQFPSTATITMEAGVYTRSARGRIEFEYTLDPTGKMLRITLNSALLQVDPVLGTKAGDITDIGVALSAPVKVTCRDKTPPFKQPCNGYRISAGDLVATVAFVYKGGQHVVITKNQGDLDIDIDHATRGFAIAGGPLRGTLPVNDKDTEFTVGVDLKGRFMNFAPNASGAESDKGAECGVTRAQQQRGNKTPVNLNAAASFEIYKDPLPAAAASYRWYEDHGLVTQRFLGDGSKHTIPPGGLSYGVHQMTLVLRDDANAVGMDTFNVEVWDTTPPILIPPPDRIEVLPPQPGSMKIALGQPVVGDECSANVTVTNDAPASGLFPAGTTKVTWTADDGHGNVTSKVQDVWVASATESGVYLVKAVIAQLLRAAMKMRQAVPECDVDTACDLDLASLAQVTRDLVRLTEAIPEARRGGVLGRLGQAETALAGAAAALARADRAIPRERPALRRQAVSSLQRAEGVLGEAGNLLH